MAKLTRREMEAHRRRFTKAHDWAVFVRVQHTNLLQRQAYDAEVAGDHALAAILREKATEQMKRP